ncbi:PREDICTED: hyaluronidase-1-like, partial [Fulmarus glacialis]|uniref:hyaluronidase-1-like n=1 Tax=Fulmarus glacialis TaxID=30455 RepID=UPI00051C2C4A
MASGWLCWVLLLLLPASACAGGPGPVLVNRPFITIWNIPTERCAKKYNVTLNLEVFDVLANDQQSFVGQDITLFYSKELGLFPYYTSEGVPVNGGLPQNASLQAHLHQAAQDIKVTLPSPRCVLDSGIPVLPYSQIAFDCTVDFLSQGPLGHYIVNVTASADLCSQSLCSGRGRCVRQENKHGFLHLDPFRFTIDLQVGKPWLVAQSLEALEAASR